jgi:hypothetical protein
MMKAKLSQRKKHHPRLHTSSVEELESSPLSVVLFTTRSPRKLSRPREETLKSAFEV